MAKAKFTYTTIDSRPEGDSVIQTVIRSDDDMVLVFRNTGAGRRRTMEMLSDRAGTPEDRAAAKAGGREPFESSKVMDDAIRAYRAKTR